MTDVASAHKRIDHLELKMEQGFSNLNEKIERVLENLGRRKTDCDGKHKSQSNVDWRVGMAVIAVIGMVGGLLGQNIVFLSNQADKHDRLEGHSVALQKHADSSSRITSLEHSYEQVRNDIGTEISALDRLVQEQLKTVSVQLHDVDKNLQREINIINDTFDEKIRALDDKLQIEFGKNYEHA